MDTASKRKRKGGGAGQSTADAHADTAPACIDSSWTEPLGSGFWGFTCLLAVACGIGAYFLFRTLHGMDTSHWKLNAFDKRLQLYSEQAFYYSFYEDLVESPSLLTGFTALFNESRSEYPSHINAIERFNIYPEVLSAVLYRALGSLAPQDPLDFMIYVLMALAGLQWAGFFMCASYLGRSPLCGVVASVFAFVYYDRCSRLNFHATLRENFAAPFMWWQIFFMFVCVRQPRVSKPAMLALAVSSFAFMISWQFAQFILLLQLAAVYLAYATCSLRRDVFLALIRVYLAVVVAVIVVTMGNTMLLASMHLLLCASLFVVIALDRERSSVLGRIGQGVLGGALMVATKLLISAVIEDDAHVFRILRAKLFHYEDFITHLYLCGPTYRAMELDEVYGLMDCYMLQLAVGVTIGLVIITLVSMARGLQSDPAFVFAAVQGVLFCVLAGTVRRLLIIAAPHLAVLAALVASGYFLTYFSKTIVRHQQSLLAASVLIAALLVAILLKTRRASALITDLKTFDGEARVDRETGNLLEFILKNTKPTAVIAADSVLTSSIKLMTRRRVPFHPHTENQEVRQRHFEFFQLFNRVPEEEVYTMLKKWEADYVVVSEGPCNLRCPEGETMDYMANLSPGQGKRGHGRPELPQFCKTVRSGTLKLFKIVYSSGPFTVLKLRKQMPGVAGNVSGA